VAHVHWAGGVGGNIFDIDRLADAKRQAAIFIAFFGNGAQLVQPRGWIEPEIEEPRASDLDRCNAVDLGELCRQCFSQRSRVCPRRFRQHHRGIGRKVAVRGIARRLDRNVAAVNPGGQRAACNKGVQRMIDMRCIFFK
jgi:hypothetical protein